MIDTSIWLEVLLDQERADESATMLKAMPLAHLRLSEFTLYSIGLGLAQRGQGDGYLFVLQRNFVDRSLRRVRLTGEELQRVPQAMGDLGLDFDDAYQYVAATSRGLELVGFDTDFDRTTSSAWSHRTSSLHDVERDGKGIGGHRQSPDDVHDRRPNFSVPRW